MVDILMGVYNGEAYLREQLDSIFGQSFSNWRLTVCDDASSDRTEAILREYQKQYPEKMIYRRNGKNSGSPKENFFQLIRESQAPYWMTCDHDDVWKKDKVETTLRCMKEMEKGSGKEMPILVHTDLTVVDQDLQVLSDSMIRSQRLNPGAKHLCQFLVQNHVTGCTMMGNRSIRELVSYLPHQALMHDWYFALVAAAFGRIGFVDESTVFYRQHGGNQVGAKDASSTSYAVKRFLKSYEARKAVYQTYEQAQGFLNQFREKLTPSQRELVEAYAQMPLKGKWFKWKTLFQYQLWKYGKLRRLGQMLYS